MTSLSVPLFVRLIAVYPTKTIKKPKNSYWLKKQPCICNFITFLPLLFHRKDAKTQSFNFEIVNCWDSKAILLNESATIIFYSDFLPTAYCCCLLFPTPCFPQTAHCLLFTSLLLLLCPCFFFADFNRQ